MEVVNLHFAESPAAIFSEPSGWLSALQVTKDDIMRGVELLVMVILSLIALLFVVRPMMRRMMAPEDAQQQQQQQLGLARAPVVADNVGQMAAAEGSEVRSLPPSATAQMIDIAQVHSQSVQKVGELAQRNPQETVSIIRQWLHESAAKTMASFSRSKSVGNEPSNVSHVVAAGAAAQQAERRRVLIGRSAPPY